MSQKFPIKYIEDNLVFNKDGECYAYFELIPYNYGFLSVQQKVAIHENFRQMVVQSRNGKIHALEIAAETNIRRIQGETKKLIKGKLAKVARQKIDEQTEALVELLGEENQVDYRFFLGFKLSLTQEGFSPRLAFEQFKIAFMDWLGEVNHEAMGDFLTMDNGEIRRYKAVERMLSAKLGRKFKVRPLKSDDFGYIIEHLYGMEGISYEDYSCHLPVKKYKKETLVKEYEYLKLTRAKLTEKPYYLEINREGVTSYAACFAIQEIIDDLDPFNSAIFYQQQSDFRFPVDTSMNIEVIENRKALSTVRNKRKELKDLDEHAANSENETSDSVVTALVDAKELESDLQQTKEALYKLSFVIRVSASTLEELEKRCDEVKDFYDEKGIKLVRPARDMLGLHSEFIPSAKRFQDDYIQYVKADLLGGLGFGATQMLGERYGIYIGYNRDNDKNVYIIPWLAAQGVMGAVTNALSAAFLGALGWGKSFFNNLVIYYVVLFGGKVIILDPKSERGGWAKHLPEIASEMNVLNLTSEKGMKGVIDPFLIMSDKENKVSVVVDVLTYLTGVGIRDGERMPVLMKVIHAVAAMEKPGMLKVIEYLKKEGTEVAVSLANHIESFVDYGLGQLFFGDGTQETRLNMDKMLNIIQVQDLVLPDEHANPEEYTATEMLSVAVMLILSSYSLEFIKQDRSLFKVVDLDEAWTFLNVAQGKTLANKLVREGRSRNSGIYFVTQNADDLIDEKIKNNLGMKFAFRSTDIHEIKKILELFNLDPEDEGLQNIIRGLGQGECLYEDGYGRVGVLKVHPVFERFLRAYDTKPPVKEEVEEQEEAIEVEAIEPGEIIGTKEE
ncbi:MAG: ATP-binding protein [Ruminococcus sp.]|nr:ATP-binding protein [Ruminococcus sp.]